MSGRYLARKGAQAILTIIAIVALNFVLFRMMPGSPERVLLRNQYLTQEKIAQIRAEWGLDKPLLPDQLVGLHDVDPPGRPRLLVLLPGHAGHRRHRRALLADDPADRLRRAHLDHRRPLARGESRMEPGWPDRPTRQRCVAGPVLDAVLRHRHAVDHHLRGGSRLVPDVGDAHASARPMTRPSTSSSTSRAISSCRSRRCRWG